MRRVMLVMGLMACPLLGSCNILGPAIYMVEGPPKDAAVFKLDKDRPTLILVDDRLNAQAHVDGALAALEAQRRV